MPSDRKPSWPFIVLGLGATAIIGVAVSLVLHFRAYSGACNEITENGGTVRWLMVSPKYLALEGPGIDDTKVAAMGPAFDRLLTIEQAEIRETAVTTRGVLTLLRLRGLNLILISKNANIPEEDIDELRRQMHSVRILTHD
jgi:hypothetical protein